MEKPFRSIAPDGQATVQAPQPWHTASFTEATRRIAVVLSGMSEFLVGICDSTVRTNLLAGRAAVAHKLVGVSNAGVACELVLCKESDYLGSSSAGLRNGLGDILGALAYA